MSLNKSRSKNLIQAQTVIRLRLLQRQDLLLWMRRTRFHNGLYERRLEPSATCILRQTHRICILVAGLWGLGTILLRSQLRSVFVVDCGLFTQPFNTTRSLKSLQIFTEMRLHWFANVLLTQRSLSGAPRLEERNNNQGEFAGFCGTRCLPTASGQTSMSSALHTLPKTSKRTRSQYAMNTNRQTELHSGTSVNSSAATFLEF